MKKLELTITIALIGASPIRAENTFPFCGNVGIGTGL